MFWSARAALDNPDLPIEFVRDTLVAMEEETEPFCAFKSLCVDKSCT
jgi:hypothetical protein